MYGWRIEASQKCRAAHIIQIFPYLTYTYDSASLFSLTRIHPIFTFCTAKFTMHICPDIPKNNIELYMYIEWTPYDSEASP